MYAFHSTVYVRPGMEHVFLANSRGHDDPILRAPGFVRRMLLRDKDHPGRFYYISVWQSREALEAYRRTEHVVTSIRDLDAENPFEKPLERVEVEVLSDDGAAEPAG